MSYRVEYRDVADERLLYEADDAPVPQQGDFITMPSGRSWVVSDKRRVEYRVAERPPHVVTVFLERADEDA